MVRRIVFLASNAAIFIVLGLVVLIAVPGGPAGWPPAAAQPGSRDCSKVDAAAFTAGVTSPTAEANFLGRGTVDDQGILTGYVLSVQIEDGSETKTSLPVESIFAGQFGALLMYSFDTDKTGSEVHAIDVRTGCDLLIVEPADVVRAITVDPSGENIYVKTVSRDTRQDLGIWRYKINGEKGEVLAHPMPATDYGPPWYTTLGWSSDGQSLVIDACGLAACATRILDLTTGNVDDYLDLHGQMIGVNDRELFAFADTDHRPSDVLAISRADGAEKIIVGGIIAAKLEADGETLWLATPYGTTEVRP